MKKSHWFFTHKNFFGQYVINTYGLGDHPTKTHTFEKEEDFLHKKQSLLDDGYDFIKHQD